VPYAEIIVCAAIPAVLYYVSVFIMVDMEAAKMGLRGLPGEDLPNLGRVFRDGAFLLVAPLSILYMLVAGYSPIKASVTAVGFVIFASFLNRRTRLTPGKFYAALVSGAQSALSIVAACAVAGIIVGVVTLTGLGLKFADLVMAIAQGGLYPALVLTMVACIVMSMGMPTTALYIILGAMVAPGLVKLGINIVAAHFFIFYYGCMAAVTPPVALSSYLAASIAGADPTRTAFQGWKLALSAFILPFIFALDPSLLLIDTTVGNAVTICLTAMLGVTALSAALEGYLMRLLSIWQRLALSAAALVLIIPGLVTDAIGAVLFAFILLTVIVQNKREKAVVA
jgi:TRAP transporter 4TM/12TM fusion protein